MRNMFDHELSCLALVSDIFFCCKILEIFLNYKIFVLSAQVDVLLAALIKGQRLDPKTVRFLLGSEVTPRLHLFPQVTKKLIATNLDENKSKKPDMDDSRKKETAKKAQQKEKTKVIADLCF